MKKVHAAESIYIDPADCDSKVSYKIVMNGDDDWERLYASVQLSDCNRTVDWSFNARDDSPIEKIDNAISALMGFRKAYAKALFEYKKAEAAKQKKEAKK